MGPGVHKYSAGIYEHWVQSARDGKVHDGGVGCETVGVGSSVEQRTKKEMGNGAQ